ncbi:tetratricopeptide repeat protein [Loktanella sp. 5RATIMAR09]|uniref:tetratricopeptide repeat protein n=1 Tax=Loktanella sp. 5RATIMAR09 TaxID=1225655 RepID=UPI0006EBB4FA|nr:tetratricopeptide repeat protein [Loktanella sp. 5RATIMAR09]
MKNVILSCAVSIALLPATSWAQEDAASAFASRDFATAKAVWLSEAADGSAEAMLGLGLLADRGFGQQRDFDVAFDWYLQAAELGLAEAQFNVAIMLDAGLGRERDVGEAQMWYTRAALRDHARAQYNLGLLYETGDGIVSNPALAAYWFGKAAQTVPAAALREVTQVTASRTLAEPDMIFDNVSTSQVEIVWNADPNANATHLVEVIEAPRVDENYGAPTISVKTVTSGILDLNGLPTENAIWRVVNLANDDTDYAAADWSSNHAIELPRGRITLFSDPAVKSMEDAASVFASSLRQAGYWVQITDDVPKQSDNFYVSYAYASDQQLAQAVAEFLPSTEQITPVKQLLRSTQPGEVTVNLSAFR